MWSYFNSMLRCMLGLINLAFRDLDSMETSSNPRSELKLCKDLMSKMDQTLAFVDIHWSSSEFLGLNHLKH